MTEALGRSCFTSVSFPHRSSVLGGPEVLEYFMVINKPK